MQSHECRIDMLITHAREGSWGQAPASARMVPNGLVPDRRAMSTNVRMSASPTAEPFWVPRRLFGLGQAVKAFTSA